MFYFIRNMWILGNVSREQIDSYVKKSFITTEEANIILSIPQKLTD